MSVQSWLSSTWRKDLGWGREWAFSSPGSHVDTTNAKAVPSSATGSPSPKSHPVPGVKQREEEPERFPCTGTAPWAARTCGTGPAAAGTRP